MSRRTKFILLISIGSLAFIYHLLSWTGVYKVYHNPTPVNEPNVKAGAFIATTNLKTPKPGDYVSYYRFYTDSIHTIIQRLVAVEGDKIEIKAGVLYVNDKNFDKNLSLNHEYKLTKKELVTHNFITKKQEKYMFSVKDTDSMSWQISNQWALTHKFEDRKVIHKKTKVNLYIQEQYGHTWNMDYFGPYTVPKGKVFVLGDNRHMSEDSRFIGPISRAHINGVLITNF